MNIGIAMFVTQSSIDIAELAQACEGHGFESLWVPEHPAIPAGPKSPWPGSPDGTIPQMYYECVDPFVALGRASAVTSTLKLGTGICLVPERNPILLAKEIATLDHFSDGRFLFGIGTGWLREETELFGIEFSQRIGYTRESIQAMKELWTKDAGEFHGKYIDFPPIYSSPKPAQKPHPPVLIGGRARNVFRRVVSWGDGWMPNRITPEELREGRQEIARLAADAGRDPDSIEVSVFGQPADPEILKAFEDAGAARAMVFADSAPRDAALRQVDDFAKKLLT